MTKIFDVEIENISKDSLYKIIYDNITGEKSDVLFLATINPEIILHARKDQSYAEILNDSLSIVDGIGLKYVLSIKTGSKFERITGVEICEYILKEAIRNDLRVLIIAKKNGFSSREEIQNFISKEFETENAKVIYEDDFNATEEGLDSEVLIVSLGAPLQEKFIAKYISKFPNSKIAIGVGGTFDYWTGKKRRAPKLVRKAGFEWLWRFFIQPNRAKRIINATILFPYFALKENYEKNKS